MDTGEATLLHDIDPVDLGERLRAARVAHGWTQTDLAGDVVSVGYVSRLESGQRRPNADVLEALAQRLGVSLDQLLRGETAREQDEVRLELDFAELSLENGEHLEAEARARESRDRALTLSRRDLADRASFLLARALEGQGNIDDAILELEPLVVLDAIPCGKPPVAIPRIKAAIALSRCYRLSGDLSLAIQTGELTLDQLADTPVSGCDEAVQLAVTVAAAFYERGDVGQAVRMCRKAIAKAEVLASPKARASAYWNASIMESERGSVAEAIPLAERALALLSEGRDGRNLGLLRTELADMQLRLDPPDVAAAQVQLDLAATELRQSSAGAGDLSRNSLSMARALLLSGDIAGALDLSAQVHVDERERSPLTAAAAKVLGGQAEASLGRTDQARVAYREAVLLLTGIGADRDAAELWFELAGLLEAVGQFDDARDAYRSAGASMGLRSLAVKPAVVQLAIP